MKEDKINLIIDLVKLKGIEMFYFISDIDVFKIKNTIDNNLYKVEPSIYCNKLYINYFNGKNVEDIASLYTYVTMDNKSFCQLTNSYCPTSIITITYKQNPIFTLNYNSQIYSINVLKLYIKQNIIKDNELFPIDNIINA